MTDVYEGRDDETVIRLLKADVEQLRSFNEYLSKKALNAIDRAAKLKDIVSHIMSVQDAAVDCEHFWRDYAGCLEVDIALLKTRLLLLKNQ